MSGSRFVGTYRSDSDWDLYGPWTSTAIDELRAMSFIKDTDASYYGDDNTNAVLNHILATEEAPLVQVSLVKDMVAKQDLLDFLKNNDNWKEYDKSLKDHPMRLSLWNFLYSLRQDP